MNELTFAKINLCELVYNSLSYPLRTRTHSCFGFRLEFNSVSGIYFARSNAGILFYHSFWQVGRIQQETSFLGVVKHVIVQPRRLTQSTIIRIARFPKLSAFRHFCFAQCSCGYEFGLNIILVCLFFGIYRDYTLYARKIIRKMRVKSNSEVCAK